MERLALEQHGRTVEVGAELFDSNCKACHGAQGEGTIGLCPPLNDKAFFTTRLEEVGWAGTLEDYIVATVSSGRMASTRPELYPGNGVPAMPAWSDHYGGPMREDQIRSIATFIMNWQSTAPDRQAAIPTLSGPPVGTDISKQLPAGDATRGQALAATQGCLGCHVATTTGPAWMASGDNPGIGTRAAERLTQPDYTGTATTPEQYLFESIVTPDVHLVEGYQPIMPKTFGASMTDQDMADLIAYLMTLK
jgi:mono/diheme cytochrome c family protein